MYQYMKMQEHNTFTIAQMLNIHITYLQRCQMCIAFLFIFIKHCFNPAQRSSTPVRLFLLYQIRQLIFMTDPQTQRIHCQTSANSYFASGSHSPRPKQEVQQDGILVQDALSPQNQKYISILKNKKQIRYFLSSYRKAGRTTPKKCYQNWLQIMSLLLNEKLIQNNYKCHSNSLEHEIQQISAQQLQPLCILQKPFKSAMLHIIVITYRCLPLKSQIILYDVEVINLQASIVYKKLNISTFIALKRQVLRLQAALRHCLTTVENQAKLIEIKIISQQIQKFISPFQDLQQIIGESRQKMEKLINENTNGKSKMKNISQEQKIQIKQCIKKYLFIKNQFYKRISRTQNAFITEDEIRIMTIAHNLIITDIKSVQDPFQSQIQQNKDNILAHFQQSINFKARNTKKKPLIKSNSQHCPFPIENAHICYSCKSKRIYFYCPTCSQTHNQIIALCWNCYSPYHESILISQQKIYEPILNEEMIGKWQALSISMTTIVGEWQSELVGGECLGQ